MNLPNCFICNRPVLELGGQFEKFDAYLLTQGDEALEQEAYGWCHSSCLSTSKWGSYWHKKYLKSQEILGYKIVQEFEDSFILLKKQDKFLFLNKNGLSYSFNKSDFKNRKSVKNGILIPVSEKYNFEFPDINRVEKVRKKLIKEKRFTLMQVVEALELKDVLMFPAVFKNEQSSFNKPLKGKWLGNGILSTVKYHQFIPLKKPKELETFI